MSLNPFTALEKLINEHGSAKILKERLALAADKYTALENQVTTLSREKNDLESENERLRKKVQQFGEERKVMEAEVEKKRTGDRPEIEQEILIALANSSGPDGPDADDIAQHFNIGKQVARFHLNELNEADLVSSALFMDRPAEWHLTQEGRRYLMNRGLIK